MRRNKAFGKEVFDHFNHMRQKLVQDTPKRGALLRFIKDVADFVNAGGSASGSKGEKVNAGGPASGSKGEK